LTSKTRTLIIFTPFCSVKKGNYIFGKLVQYALLWYKVYFGILKDEFKFLTGRTFSRNKMARSSVKKSVLSRFWIHLSVFRNKLYIKIKPIVQAFQIYNYLLTEIIIKRIIWHQRRDIKFISKYWKMNSKSWQDGLFHGTKWRENDQCSRLWCQIILLITILFREKVRPVKILNSSFSISK
jgi:hypothetical protein